MKIDIHCSGASRGDAHTMLGGCGVVLRYSDDHGRSRSREMHFGLGNSDQLLCEWQAARIGLASVVPGFRTVKVSLHVESIALANFLGDKAQTANQVLVELKRWFGYYRDIDVVVHADAVGPMLRARQLALMGQETQREFDSLTQGSP